MKRARDLTIRGLCLAAAGLVAGCGDAQPPDGEVAVPAQGPDEAHVSAERAAVASAATRRPSKRFLVAKVKAGRELLLHSRPGGRVVARVGPRTVFGNRSVLGVAAARNHWLAVTAPQLPNHKLGWFRPARRNVALTATRTWLRIDLSQRRLDLFRGRKRVDHARVGIGRRGSPTPTGRYSVTDLLPGPRFNAAYGRFILALSGRQTRTPPGWTGGNRLAIHGTNNEAEVGNRASAGCVVAGDADLVKLVKRVDPGTPVVIRR